jgi:NitT/TauT family transport system ATP-binding protein
MLSPATAAPPTGLEIRSVEKTFDGGVRAVDGLSMDVAPGEFVALLGPSGCGKSTLLRMIAGLDHPTAGRIVPVKPAAASDRSDRDQRDLAFVFQDAHLLPWRNVLRNAALPLELAGVPRADREERAAEVLTQVGLGDVLKRYPAQLSGGMRMRVSLARALVTQPSLLLLDEPFAALDEITRQQLDDLLRNLWIDRRMTVLFVTHSINEAAYLADRAIVFSSRPARIVLDHRLSLPAQRTPELRGSATFAGEMATLYAALAQGSPLPATGQGK